MLIGGPLLTLHDKLIDAYMGHAETQLAIRPHQQDKTKVYGHLLVSVPPTYLKQRFGTGCNLEVCIESVMVDAVDIQINKLEMI